MARSTSRFKIFLRFATIVTFTVEAEQGGPGGPGPPNFIVGGGGQSMFGPWNMNILDLECSRIHQSQAKILKFS